MANEVLPIGSPYASHVQLQGNDRDLTLIFGRFEILAFPPYGNAESGDPGVVPVGAVTIPFSVAAELHRMLGAALHQKSEHDKAAEQARGVGAGQ